MPVLGYEGLVDAVGSGRADLASYPIKELHLERPRVSRLLEEAIQHPIAAVFAGAGYGKTSTVYSFLHKHDDFYSFWYWFSERDNIETSFWENYVNTSYGKNIEMRTALMQIGLPKTKSDYEKYFAFVRAAQPVLETFPKYVLVFDDFHSITNPHVLEFMDRAIRTQIPKRTILILSRLDPNTTLPCLTAIGNVPSITEEDLRFNESEIAEYLKKLGLSISTQGTHEILRDTQGWPFALSLIGQSLKKSPQYRSDIFTAMKGNVFRIFDDEVFGVISKKLENFLIRLSLLSRLPSELLRELDMDGDLIAEMDQQSAFIRYDPSLNTYVIHHLLLRYLQDHQHLLSQEEKRETYKRAGDYCANNDIIADAIDYYEKAGDYNSLFELVRKETAMLMPPDLAEYMLKVFVNIPADVAKTHYFYPVLHFRILIGLGRLTEFFAQAERYEKQFLALPETEDTTRALSYIYMSLGCARQLRSTFDDVYDFDKYFEKQDEYYCKNTYLVEKSSSLRTTGTFGSYITNVGTAREGALEEYIAALERSETHMTHAINGFSAGMSDIANGELMFYRNDMAGAETRLLRGFKKAKAWGQFDLMYKAYFYLLRIYFARGDALGVFQTISNVKALLSETKYLTRYTIHDIICGWYYLRIDKLELIPEWLKSDFSPYFHANFLDNFGNHIKLQYCFAARNYAEVLNFAENRYQRESILFERLETLIIEACTHYQMKNKAEAFESLGKAYETARANQLITPFAEWGKHMRTLTTAALREESCLIPDAWLKAVNRQASAYAKFQANITSEYNTEHNMTDDVSLTAREKQILIALSRGLSRSEIATTLGISLSTVKIMMGNLYDKIGATNLADAIRIGLGEKWI